jgi:hypothetical protein
VPAVVLFAAAAVLAVLATLTVGLFEGWLADATMQIAAKIPPAIRKRWGWNLRVFFIKVSSMTQLYGL